MTIDNRAPSRIYAAADLKALPRPQWLVDGVMEEEGLSVLYGQPRSAKTFLALDLAGHIVTGEPWCGRKVRNGHVLYVAAEGAFGIRQRLDAFERHHGISDLSGAFFIIESVPLMDQAEIERLATRIEVNHPQVRLIVIDTFSRCFRGDENSAEEVGQAIEGLDLLRRKTKAAILLVHHTIKSGDMYRGSSVLEGAADTMVATTASGKGLVRVENVKQKNAAAFEELNFSLQEVDVTDEDGITRTSCVLTQTSKESGKLSINLAVALGILAERGELGIGEWRSQTAERLGSEIREGTFRHWKDRLRDQGLIESPSQGRWNAASPATATYPPKTADDGMANWEPAATTTPLSKGVGGADEAGLQVQEALPEVSEARVSEAA